MKETKKSSSKKPNLIQPEINIGLVGHVDHGKTTLLEALSGVWADTHSEEIKRGITIKLGYADTIFYKCKKCKDHECYGTSETCKYCNEKCEALRKVSFIDAPGHETLMATMLSGAAIMDGALLLIAANEKCPQPQTREHLTALGLINVENIVIVQNKIDLVSEEQALENYKQIKNFIKGTIAENSPIIPVSAQHKVNIGALIHAIQEILTTPKRDAKEAPRFYVARSFDVNKPGTEIKELVGGVLGGALKQGSLKKDEEIELIPGRKIEREGKEIWESIKTKILDIKTGGVSVEEVYPGGSVGILTGLDPSLVKSNNLTGNVAGLPGKMPNVLYELILKPKLLDRVVGTKEELVVEPIKKNELLLLNVNAAATVGMVSELSKDRIKVKLRLPIAADKDDNIAISRNLGARWRLIGVSKVI